MPLRTGEIFAGYRVLRLLGSGGMGDVYLVQHPRLPRHEALKVLRQDLSNDASFRERFIREADLAAGLRHPHIVGVHDRGEHEGHLWIAMDYIDGTDAAELMLQQYPAGMPVEIAAPIITAVASALDYAHRKGLLHRDVKPANIIVADADGDDPDVYLADFGIARPLDDISGVTTTNMTVGTVAYAAPEQLMGEQMDGRADQYALAATAYHLLTGMQPFPHSNPAVVISRHLNAPVPALADIRADLAAVDPVLNAALAKDPNDRFACCADFALALTEAAAPHALGAAAAPTTRASAPRRSQVTTNTSGVAGATAHSDSVRSGSRKLIGASVVAVLLVLVVIMTVWRPWQHQQSSSTAISSSIATPTSTPTAAAPPVVLPDVPPANSGCSGAVVGHSDVKHPQLGMVRVFLFLDRSLRVAGCALPVTEKGRVLTTIGVNAFVGNDFGFADPATDATGNMFIKYRDASNGNYADGGVVVLIPNADGFENVVSYTKMQQGGGDPYMTGVNDYYSVELLGPVDGVYAIRQTANTCEPDCASGRLTVRNLHWDGSSYVPETEPPAPPPPPEPAQSSPPAPPTPAEPSPAETGCVEGSTKYSPASGDISTCENGRFHEGPYGYHPGGE
ncbi:serine/threonine protein kinase [Mycobacterium barrassiae]|nr:serine/threonine protein kinase [Mycobacterium barrassiae]